MEGVRALVQRQAEIAQEAFAESSALFREWTHPSAPEDRVAKHVDVAKQAVEKGLANARELSELTTKAATDVFSVITRRVSEGLDEARLYAKKHS